MNLLSIEAMVLPELQPAALVRVAAAAGYDSVGMWVDPATWTARTTSDVRNALRETGITILEAEVIRIAGPPSDDDRRALDIAAGIGARFMIAVGMIQDHGRVAETLAVLAEHARAGGVRIALEFGRFSAVGTIGEAVMLAEAAGPEIAILPDPIHIARSGALPADLRAIAPARIGFAQICDAGPPPADPSRDGLLDEARHHRRVIGEGVLPLRAYLAALPPGIPLSIESRSRAAMRDFPDPLARARMHAAALRRLIEQGEGR